MTIDIDKMKALALAATPGKWQTGYGTGLTGSRTAAACSWDCTGTKSVPVSAGKDAIAWVAGFEPDDKEFAQMEVDAAYIAAANPTALLELIAEVERLRAMAQTKESA